MALQISPIPVRTRLLAACLLWTACAAALPARSAAPHAPVGLLASLPARWLDDQAQRVDLRALAGQRLVVTMAYASCHRICPMTMQHLERLQQQLDASGSSATIVVVGYDPESDDPAAWHQYRRERGLMRPNWLFLTAPNPAQAREFAQRMGFDFWKYDEHVMHDQRVVVIDPQGNLQQTFGPDEALDAQAIASGRHALESRGS